MHAWRITILFFTLLLNGRTFRSPSFWTSIELIYGASFVGFIFLGFLQRRMSYLLGRVEIRAVLLFAKWEVLAFTLSVSLRLLLLLFSSFVLFDLYALFSHWLILWVRDVGFHPLSPCWLLVLNSFRQLGLTADLSWLLSLFFRIFFGFLLWPFLRLVRCLGFFRVFRLGSSVYFRHPRFLGRLDVLFRFAFFFSSPPVLLE